MKYGLSGCGGECLLVASVASNQKPTGPGALWCSLVPAAWPSRTFSVPKVHLKQQFSRHWTFDFLTWRHVCFNQFNPTTYKLAF